jgi:hypothetical protein
MAALSPGLRGAVLVLRQFLFVGADVGSDFFGYRILPA